jgi:transposase-like protein
MKKNESIIYEFRVKTYSVKEVAGLYGISTKTLKKWLTPFEKEIGERRGYFYYPKQVKVIFDKLGLPETHI